jgi:L-aspartate oxidase
MAMRAHVAVADLEFMQFHPTALHHPAMPRPLLSEALRGHGAILRDASGAQFVDELAPRDVVSRAMAAKMAEEGSDHLWLDATGLEDFARRFPTLAASLEAIGLDPATSWIPIAPAAHHLAGGVVTDLDGATSLRGLSAAGEVACSGVHGANRLASNSLLEGMVFGARVAEAIAHGRDIAAPTGPMTAILDPGAAEIRADHIAVAASTRPEQLHGDGHVDVAALRAQLQRAMTAGAGVVRSASSVDAAMATVEAIDAELHAHGRLTEDAVELCNLLTVARGLLVAAQRRTESRGNHSRAEFVVPDPAWRRRQVLVEVDA